MTRLLGLGWVLLASAPMASAHEDLNEQIAGVTVQILESHDRADLYLKRAELFRWHEDWPAAMADYERAERLAPALDAVHLGRGKMLLAAGRCEEAQAELDKFLAAQPGHLDGFLTRARVEARHGKPLLAADDFARAIAAAPRPEPEYYLERADALVAAGDEHFGDALHCLDEGTARLGNLPTLGLRAIELEQKQKHYDEALARLEKLSTNAVRKEAWLERRGDLLIAAGRPEEARQAYQAATQALGQLPAPRRTTKAANELAARLQRKTAP